MLIIFYVLIKKKINHLLDGTNVNTMAVIYITWYHESTMAKIKVPWHQYKYYGTITNTTALI